MEVEGDAKIVTPAYSNPLVTLYQGDVLETLSQLPVGSVHCIVSSPPYWGLRSYSGEQQRVWDAEEGCQHEWGVSTQKAKPSAKSSSARSAYDPTKYLDPMRSEQWLDHKVDELPEAGAFCLHCAAWRGPLGREPTVEMYIAHLMQVMAALWRVLRNDGVCWINLDDTRQSGSHNGHDGGPKQMTNRGAATVQAKEGIRQKDMALVPERFILAAQAQGWYVRSKVFWWNPKTIPESADDRPTDAYQMLYCLVKTAKTQFWTHRELPGVRKQPKPDYRWQKVRPLPDDPSWHNSSFSGNHDLALYKGVSQEARNVEVLQERTTPPPGWTPKNKMDWRRVNLWWGHSVWWDGLAIAEPSKSGPSDVKKMVESKERIGGRNKEATDPLLAASAFTNIGHKRAVGGPSHCNARNVQIWPTEGLGSFRVNGKTLTHFAAFCRELPLWCIRASCPAQCCGSCGAGYSRMMEQGELREHPARQNRNVRNVGNLPLGDEHYSSNGGTLGLVRETRTLGWLPTCSCPQDSPTVPGIVLDCFVGSGTTALAAQELGRRCWGIDLSADYIGLSQHRLERQQPAMAGMEV